MKKFVCQVCGYVYEGEAAPEKCPQCNAPASKFTEQSGEMNWAAEHVVGVAQGVSEDILEDLPDHDPAWWCKVEDGYILNLKGERKNKIPYDYNS